MSLTHVEANGANAEVNIVAQRPADSLVKAYDLLSEDLDVDEAVVLRWRLVGVAGVDELGNCRTRENQYWARGTS